MDSQSVDPDADHGEPTSQTQKVAPGRLVICGSPIGNMGDASARLVEALESATIIAAEDTRRTRRLMESLGVLAKPRLVSCYDATEAVRATQFVEAARQGATVALVTDAGMPGVSDPGFRVVAAFAAAGLEVTVVPGPSSVTAAIAVSGLPSDRWCFEGFLPRSGGDRRKRLAGLAAEERTMVFLEAPHRVRAMLVDLTEAFGGGRRGVACRELTKTHEEIVRASLDELVAWSASKEMKGELTIVVAGADPPQPRDYTAAELHELVVRSGLGQKEGIAAVAKATGIAKKVVYAAVIEAKPGRGTDL